MTSYLDNPGNQLVEQVLRIQKHDRSGEFVSHRALALGEDIIATTRFEGARNITALIGAVEDGARPLALSYRKFRVGAAAMVTLFGGDRQWSYMLSHGANVKPVDSDVINVHAEHELMIKAKESTEEGEEVNIPIMLVIGDLQADQQTGRESPALHPCGVCRGAFMEEDSPISQETLIVTANPGLTIFEWFSVRALNRFHATGEYRDMGMAEFPERPLSFDRVEPDPVTGTISLSRLETDEYLASDHEVALRLTVPLMRYAEQLNA